ncbi:SxtJ family membrane protein [Gracilimonas sediminicola]|uniref:SxtJ family membrane protein n=1 Tax=Gracilimonas sediminicola TaxID=2952158 RepID=A0A9X2L686_9BACT|nr:SxtJ family membrane protein [Gracilimonas sediminicola]MCP9292338.1 SxtJ family membrane protein [Gracilimonas sediminicola]
MLEPRSLEFIKEDPSTPKTQLVIVTGFLVLAAIFDSEVIAYLALIVGLLSFIPPIGDRIVWGWYKLAEGLGWFNSRVLLSLVYYLVVTPIALLFRLFGNDPLLLKDTKGSMYNYREHTYTKEDLENPW